VSAWEGLGASHDSLYMSTVIYIIKSSQHQKINVFDTFQPTSLIFKIISSSSSSAEADYAVCLHYTCSSQGN
jgi:hypothetical protein